MERLILMIATILLFELKQRLRRISTYIYFGVFLFLGAFFMLLSGGGIPGSYVDFGTGGKVLVNSPYALNQIIVYIALFGVIVVAAIAGQATFQDIDSNSTAFFYTAPIRKVDYLLGRCLGALAVELFIFPSIAIGAFLAAHMPWMDPSRLGPGHFLNYLQPYLLLVIPNLIFLTAFFFALGVLTRRMLPVYAGSIIMVIGFFIAGQLSTGIHTTLVGALADPMGSSAVDYLTQYWTPFERNLRLIPFSGALLLNRVLWLGFGVVVLAITYWRFSFSQPVVRSRKAIAAAEPALLRSTRMAIPAVHQEFSAGPLFHEWIALTRLQFNETVKNVFFGVLLLAGALFSFIAASGYLNPGAVPVYPVTYLMSQLGAGGFSVFALAITTFYAGELVWRERDAGIAQIADATPAPRWVMFLSKLTALMMMEVVLSCIVLLVGVTVQLLHGYHRFEFGVYFTELFCIRLAFYWILCALALFVHTVVNQKYLGHFVMVLYYGAIIALSAMGFEHHLYLAGRLPTYIYSDMNGYGPYAAPIFWFTLYWLIFAVILAILTNLLWVRGMEGGWGERFRLAAGRFKSSAVAQIGLARLHPGFRHCRRIHFLQHQRRECVQGYLSQ